MDDAKDYVTRKDHEMYWIDDPEHPPPMNKTLLLTNEGQVLGKGKLTPENITHYLHWIEMPVIPKTKPWLEKRDETSTNANVGHMRPAESGAQDCTGTDQGTTGS